MQAGGANVVDSFFASMLVLLALIATGYAISSSLRMRAEETSGRVEPLLASSIGRLRWAASHLGMALAGSAIVLIAAGVGIGLAHAIASRDASELPRLAAAALTQLPGGVGPELRRRRPLRARPARRGARVGSACGVRAAVVCRADARRPNLAA